MNLQVNPEQLLVLYETVISSAVTTSEPEKKAVFNELKTKIHDLVSETLSPVYESQNKQKLSTWMKSEGQKIEQLNEELSKLKLTKLDRKDEPDDGLHFPVRI